MIIELLTWEYPVFLLFFPCLLPASFRFLSRYHLDTTPLPHYYHPILSPYLPTSTACFHLSVFTFHLKNLYTRKFCCTFAPATVVHELCEWSFERMRDKNCQLSTANCQLPTANCPHDLQILHTPWVRSLPQDQSYGKRTSLPPFAKRHTPVPRVRL